MRDDRLRNRTERFAVALERAGAERVSAEPRRDGAVVFAAVPGPLVNKAQSVAAAHGFNLHGREDGGDADPGVYRFETDYGPADYEPGGGLNLPGGVR